MKNNAKNVCENMVSLVEHGPVTKYARVYHMYLPFVNAVVVVVAQAWTRCVGSYRSTTGR